VSQNAPGQYDEILKRHAEEIRKQREAALAAAPGFDALVGQGGLVQRLKRFGEMYASRHEVPGHVLIAGPDGMGKGMFARAFAKTYNSSIAIVDVGGLQIVGDLTAVLTGLESGTALVLANADRLRKPIVPVLETALNHFKIDLHIGEGVTARVHPFQLAHFSCVATVLRRSDMLAGLASCFNLSVEVQPYSDAELGQVALNLATRAGLSLVESAIPVLVGASDRTPKSIQALINRFSHLGTKNITEDVAAEAFEAFGIQSQVVGAHSPASDLQRLSGIEFEKVVLALLVSMGFRAEMTRTTGDGGIDIIAVLNRPIVGGRFLIQCKRFEAPIGSPIVREFYGAVVADRMATKGILITTSEFTPQAREFARNVPLELIDGQQLKSLLAASRAEHRPPLPG
jgi:Holliday junction resolvasome RuvABC ATP-dependent DNA helicase subunit